MCNVNTAGHAGKDQMKELQSKLKTTLKEIVKKKERKKNVC